MDATVIVFDDWEKALKAGVPANRYRSYREAIVKFRYWLRETGKLPDVAIAMGGHPKKDARRSVRFHWIEKKF